MAIGVIWADIWNESIWNNAIWAQAAANASPTDITLTSQAVSVNGGINAIVGILAAVDADIGDSHTFTLVAGTGDTDNAAFNISGNQLRCDDPSSTGIGTYSVRIQADVGTSTPYQEAFIIQVLAASAGLSFSRSLSRGLGRGLSRNLGN